MRFLFYTDLHAADQNPRSRTGNYKEDILAKLTEIIELANKYEVDYLINGADTFDRKSPWRVSHRMVQQMIRIMKDFDGRRHLTMVGTHDVPSARKDKLDQQPLGSLREAGVIQVLDGIWWPQCPAIFHFVPYTYDLDRDPANYAVSRGPDMAGTDPIITVAHGMIVPPGGTFFGDFTDAETIHTEAELVLYGHPHTPDGIYKNSRETIFVAPGSVSRRDASPYNRARVPAVILIERETSSGVVSGEWKFKTIPLQTARPPEEVFAGIMEDEEDENVLNERIETFVEKLQTASIQQDAWGLHDLVAEVQASKADNEVKALAQTLLEQSAN